MTTSSVKEIPVVGAEGARRRGLSEEVTNVTDDKLDLSLDDATTNVDDGSSSSSSNGGSSKGGGGKRTNVFLDGAYGTNCVTPDTDCYRCNNRAVGVLVLEQNLGGRSKEKGKPMCSRHKREFKEENPHTWERQEFRRFID